MRPRRLRLAAVLLPGAPPAAWSSTPARASAGLRPFERARMRFVDRTGADA